mgnify:CR=1 FL=1|jgi:uncharacterized membrane protein
MNHEPLLKYFPELADLERETQLQILAKAYDQCFGPANKLRIWRNNLIGGLALTAVSLLLILVLGPALKLPSGATAAVVMLVVLPGFFVWQQRKHIQELRPAVNQCLAEFRSDEQNKNGTTSMAP